MPPRPEQWKIPMPPPVGSLRWQPPQPAAHHWTGVRDATTFGQNCAQPPGLPSGIASTSENCLYLNVLPSSCSCRPCTAAALWSASVSRSAIVGSIANSSKTCDSRRLGTGTPCHFQDRAGKSRPAPVKAAGPCTGPSTRERTRPIESAGQGMGQGVRLVRGSGQRREAEGSANPTGMDRCHASTT